MLNSQIILAIVWLIYCLLHSLLAATTVKHRLQRILKINFKYYRIGYTIFSFIGLVAILIFQFSIVSAMVFLPSLPVKFIGILMMVIGGSIMAAMIWKYFMQLSGIRWLTSNEEASKLQIQGLHRYVRHPLYLGTFIFIWGWFLLSPSISFLISNTIITLYTLIGLRFEERKLIREFGQDYIEYRKRVPGLIPKF